MMDFHTHLDLYPNALDILDRVNKENSFTLAVTTSPRAWIATSQVFSKYKNIRVALGLHPEIVDKKFGEFELLLSSVHKTNFIGEVGIDGSTVYTKTLEKQVLVFDRTISECERAGGKIISIHSRKSASQILSIIKKYPNCGIPILHWFSGSIAELELAIKMNCYFSINPLMLMNAKGKNLVSRIPLQLVLPESDGPFTSFGGRTIMPWQAIDICLPLSIMWNISIQEVKMQLGENCNNFF